MISQSTRCGILRRSPMHKGLRIMTTRRANPARRLLSRSTSRPQPARRPRFRRRRLCDAANAPFWQYLIYNRNTRYSRVTGMKLKELSDALPALSKPEIVGAPNTPIESLAYDSRQVFPGVAFVCLKGERTDGHDYIDDAVKRGAIALVVNHARAEKALAKSIPFLSVEDTRKALPYIAAEFYGKPSEKLDLIGVTGTNGKTTTTYMIASILQAAGEKTGVIGTVGVQIDGKSVPTQWTVSTTPESLDLQQLFSRMGQERVRHAVMEVTSHA